MLGTIGISVATFLVVYTVCDIIADKVTKNITNKKVMNDINKMKEICDDIRNECDSIIDVIEDMRKVIRKNN